MRSSAFEYRLPRNYNVRCPRCGSSRIIVPVLIPAVIAHGVWESVALDTSYVIDPADIVTCTICQLEGEYWQFEQ